MRFVPSCLVFVGPLDRNPFREKLSPVQANRTHNSDEYRMLGEHNMEQLKKYSKDEEVVEYKTVGQLSGLGLIGQGGTEAFAPIPTTATPAHTYMDIWAARLGDDLDLTASFEPTVDHIPAQGLEDLREEEELTADQIQALSDDEYFAQLARGCQIQEAKSARAADLERDAMLTRAYEDYREACEYQLILAMSLESWLGLSEGTRSQLYQEAEEALKHKDCEYEPDDPCESETEVDHAELVSASNDEPTSDQIEEAQGLDDLQEEEDSYRTVTVETGTGYTFQITEAQWKEDEAAGLFVEINGDLMYKTDFDLMNSGGILTNEQIAEMKRRASDQIAEDHDPTPNEEALEVEAEENAEAEAEVLGVIRDDDLWYWNVKNPEHFPDATLPTPKTSNAVSRKSVSVRQVGATLRTNCSGRAATKVLSTERIPNYAFDYKHSR
jgi:hypothetical protein